MITKQGNKGFKALIDGVKMKPLVWEDKTLLCEFHMEGGYDLPSHSHIYEQAGYLISGKLRFRIDNEWHDLVPGDSWCVPENVEHEARVIEDSVAIEVFVPVREEYLPE